MMAFSPGAQSKDVDAVVRPPLDDFGGMYRAEFAFVFNSLRRLGVARRDLEDLAHDVFFTAYRRRDSYDPKRPLKPWLFGIAFRVASDFRGLARQAREVSQGDDGFDAPDEKRLPDEDLAVRQDRELVLRALQRIDLARRAVFVLHDLEGQTVPDIAASLDIPEGTAYSRLRQARFEFADAVKALRPGGER
jgi:RNA polymerase sigma-70 factor, ECF subfamily